MKLNENQLRMIIRESLNEISWQKAKDAETAVNNTDSWNGLQYDIKELIEKMSEMVSGRYNHSYGRKIFQWMNSLQKMADFIDRKEKQKDNIVNLSDQKFKDSHNGMSYDEFGGDIDDRELESMDGADGHDNFMNNLSDQEKEYLNYDRNGWY